MQQLHVAPYDPTVFDVVSMQDAMAIILTNEDGGYDTLHRWEVETPWIGELLVSELKLTSSSLVLDYGCGVGRLAKELINQVGCSVIGVDISANMRVFATRNVASSKFAAVSPEMLDFLVGERGLKFDAAFSVWVLQHCIRVRDEVKRIHRALTPEHKFLLVNESETRIPTTAGWACDGVDIRRVLTEQGFSQDREARLPVGIVSQGCSDRTFWATYSA